MKPRVVVVDDAAFIREILVQILLKADYEIVGEAIDGDEAVDVVCKTKPDFVIMDIVMPKKSGIQAAKEILEKIPNLKILAVSTEGNETMIYKAMEAGCMDYIVKPFKNEEILAVLKSIKSQLEVSP